MCIRDRPYIDCSSVNLLFIGGDVVNYNNMMFTHGEKALAYLEDIFVNKAFIGTDCVDLEAGLTINHSYSLDVYKKILDKSRQTILLASKSKFDRIALQPVSYTHLFKFKARPAQKGPYGILRA